MYSIASFLVTLLDVVLSLIMVLAISEIGNFGKSWFQSGFLAILFIVLVALTKVTLDKFFITPVVRKWGWKVFNRINQTFQKNITTALATLFVLERLTEEKNTEKIPLVIESADKYVQQT